MIFGFIEGAITTTSKVVEDVVDVGVSVVTLGEYGELSKENVSRIVGAGVTVYALSEATGIAVDVIEKILDE